MHKAARLSLIVHHKLPHYQVQADMTSGMQAHDKGNKLPHHKLDCVVYRASQKRICREYLIRAQAELAQEMDTMRRLMHNSARQH